MLLIHRAQHCMQRRPLQVRRPPSYDDVPTHHAMQFGSGLRCPKKYVAPEPREQPGVRPPAASVKGTPGNRMAWFQCERKTPAVAGHSIAAGGAPAKRRLRKRTTVGSVVLRCCLAKYRRVFGLMPRYATGRSLPASQGKVISSRVAIRISKGWHIPVNPTSTMHRK